MIALLVTLVVLAAIALPAFVAGVHVGRGQRRARGRTLPAPRRRLPARDVIREAERIGFGNDPAGVTKAGRSPW